MYVISELHMKQNLGHRDFSNSVCSIKLPLLLHISIQHTITIFVIAKSV